MSYVIALVVYILTFYVLWKVLSSKWFEENKEKELNKFQMSLVLIWFVSFISSQIYLIDGVMKNFVF